MHAFTVRAFYALLKMRLLLPAIITITIFFGQVSVLVFNVFGVNCAIDVKGEDTTVSFQINQVLPKQHGNISVRQYLSNRSLGK